MGRAKIPMELIDNVKKRKIAFNTRKGGLIKKARELATLCDVNVAMIIYGDNHEITPEIFPPDTEKVNSLIDSYKLSRCTDPARISRYTLKEFYTDRNIKIKEELVKTKKKNLEAKYPTWFDFLNNYSEAGLRELALGLESKIDDIQTRINESVNKISDIENVDPYSMYYPILDPIGDIQSRIDQSAKKISDIQNVGPDSPCYPTLDPIGNPNFMSFYPNPLVMLNQDDNNNVIMQSGNPNLTSFYPNSLLDHMMLNQDDNNNVIMKSGNPNLLSEDDDNNVIGNPNSSVYPKWLLDMMLNEDDNNVIHDENFSLQSPLMENSFRLSSSILGYSCEIVN